MTIYMRNLEQRRKPGDSISIDTLKPVKKKLKELQKKEQEQRIAEMILCCSPESEIWVKEQYIQKYSLKKREKENNRKTCLGEDSRGFFSIDASIISLQTDLTFKG